MEEPASRPGIAGRLVRHCLRHWRGEGSLARAFWIDLVALRVLVLGLQDVWMGAGKQALRGVPLVPIVLAMLVVHGALFVWQAVGVVRAAEVHARDSGSQASAIGAQLGLVALFCLTLAYALAGYQTTLAPAEESFAERMARERAAGYTLEHLEGGHRLRLSGLISLGTTRRVRALLDESPGIREIVLESDGGNVYEARGLAHLFHERALSTRIDARCASACAVAFIGGTRRVLGQGARLGLHRYRIDGAHAAIVTDTAREQRRDKRLYAKAGVAAWFVERMFDAGAAEMWWPRPEELLRADVVHEIER